MKSLLLLLLLLTNYSFQNNPLQDYCNDRFSFCIQYPSSFKGQGESDNEDGQVFLSKDKQAEVRAYGMLVLEEVNENIDDEFATAAKNLEVSYKVIKSDWFIISGLDKEGKIAYRKTVKKKIQYMGEEEASTFVYQTLMITYPKSQQTTYGSYCKVIAKSFQ